DVQAFSVQDGPGIRTTAFLKGCPLVCPWCHSPESQAFHSQLSWIAMRCIGTAKCGKCIKACKKEAISLGRRTAHPVSGEEIQHVKIDRARCDNCGDCAKVCFPASLYICGKDYTVEELVERVVKDKPFYDKSGGGVTISGGEALSQHRFTAAVLRELKERNIHTALDTTGYAKRECVDEVLPYTDLFLYDLKHMNSEIHQKMVRVPNELILSNAGYIASRGGKFQMRIPVIPQFNDSEENIRETAEFCRSLGEAVVMVQLLPYHNLGVVKYQRIDDSKTVMEAVPPAEEKIARLKSIMEEYGLHVTVH
ncbi:MAG: glycyl-radical enzyme activating protein, partial [Spirochaetaceae bacterium]|nr:glycyl-radical enzyme activating protein [Spirochaetaceae bacterium]